MVVRDPGHSKDVLQETALVLLRMFREWDSTRPFLPWAIGAAKFKIVDHERDAGLFFDALSDGYTKSTERCFPRNREMLWALVSQSSTVRGDFCSCR